jgi:hypothetical protein
VLGHHWILGHAAHAAVGQGAVVFEPSAHFESVPDLPRTFPTMVVVGTRNCSFGTPFLPSNTSTGPS